jgi:hypothetical protein
MFQAYSQPMCFKSLFVSSFIYFILNFMKVRFNNLAFISHKVRCCIYSTACDWLMLFRDIISVDCKRRMKDVSTPCGNNGEFGL